jgi:hypothetical protein
MVSAMERSLKNITTLTMDLDLHCSNWGINPRVTETQHELWPGSALPHTALGTDDPHCLRLLKEDGHDGEPVGSCKKARAATFISSTEHLSPPERDLIRFGVFCHLGFFRTLHLVMKNRWEEFVLGEKGQPAGSHAPYAECLTNFEEGALARLLDRFRLGLGGGAGTEQTYLLFEEHGNLASKLGFDRQRLSALVDQMILSRVHTCGAGSPELDSFEARQEREIALLREAGREAEDEFWLKKSCWLTIQCELEDKLLLREDIRLKNFNVTMEWMALFGTVYIELLEAQMLCHQLERRMAIKQAEPSLSDEEIDRRVKESIAEELASIKKVKGDALQAASLGHLHEPEGEPMSGEQLDRYHQDAKKIIREIWRLTHPDTLDRAFTERQRERLREYLEQVVKIRKSEALLDVRAISVLSDILTKVKELYDVMGIDLEPTSVIRGDTLAAQTAWLENEIQKIESQIQELMAEIQAMSMDPDIREKLASMAGEETRKATLLGLEQLKKAFEKENVVLQAENQPMIDTGRTPVASR